jgi:hypothetical protein
MNLNTLCCLVGVYPYMRSVLCALLCTLKFTFVFITGHDPEPASSTPNFVTCVYWSSSFFVFSFIFCFNVDAFCEIFLLKFLCKFYVHSRSHIHVAAQKYGYNYCNSNLLDGIFFQLQISSACNNLRHWIFKIVITRQLSGAVT